MRVTTIMKTHKRIKFTGKADTQKKKRKESYLITIENHQSTKMNSKRQKGKKNKQTNQKRINKMT
jgi:hypothetical protein